MRASWRDLGDRLAARQAATWSGVLLLTLVGLVLPLAGLYAIRGRRGAMLYVFGLAGAAVFALAFSFPYPALLVSLVIATSGLDAYLPGPVASGLMLIVLARATFDVLGGKRVDWGSSLFRGATLVLLAIALTSFLQARNIALALAEMRLILTGLAAYLAIAAFATGGRRVRQVAVTVSLGLALGGCIAILTMVRRGAPALLALASEARVAAGGWDANVAAVFGNCMIPITAFLAFDQRGWRRAGLFVVLLVLVASVILSGSRAGLAVLGVVLVLLLLRGRRYRPLAVVGAGIVFAVVTYLPERYWMRFLSVGQLGDIVVDRSLQLRQQALETGFMLFRENWLTGVGLGNFLVESTRFISTPVMAHNAFIEVAVNLGAFGLLAYVTWLASGLGMVARATRLHHIAHDASQAEMARVIGLAVLFFCAGALTLSIPFYPMLWLLLALANGCRVASERGEP